MLYIDICSEFNSESSTATTTTATTTPLVASVADVKISKNNEEICLLPHKLLSVEMDISAGDADAPIRGGAEGKEMDPNSMNSLMLPYIMNEMQCRTWSYPLPIMNSTSSSTNSSTSVEPASKRMKPNQAESTTSTTTPTSSVMSTAHEYIHSLDRINVQIGNDIYDDFLETKSIDDLRSMQVGGGDENISIPSIIAIDCEMVETVGGVELARVSVIDENLTVLYDTYVQPTHQVLDYRTEYSGITPELLVGIETTLVDVQYHLLTKLISLETLVIGHSLENDLKTLRIVHRYGCIDTAMLYPHVRGFPYRNKLKYLTNEYLKIKIQGDQIKGHDSVEDAVCAMKLVLLKVEHGPSFGHKRKQGSTNNAIMMNNSNIICCEDINQHGEDGSGLQRIPIVGASYQKHSIPVGFFYNSEKEGKEYMTHCHPQGSFIYIPTADTNSNANNSASSNTKRTAGYEPHTHPTTDTADVVNELKEFITGLYQGQAQDQGQGQLQPLEESKARAVKSLCYISHPYIDKTTLKTFLNSLKSVYNEQSGCRYNTDGVTNTISNDNYSNTLFIVTRQANLRPLIDLANKKRICMKNRNKQMTVTTWNRELEIQLREMIKINNNDGQCMTWMC